MTEKRSITAIDGPSASGKSTVARRVAAELSRLYVDSGSLYRGITWKALRDGVSVDDELALADLIENINIEFYTDDASSVRFKIDSRELDEELRTSEINENVSKVASVAEVRLKIVAWLKELVEFGDLVIEGRDIGTAVFPEADHKFYLDASIEERSRRRHVEISESGTQKGESEVARNDVRSSLLRRDTRDSERSMDPLKVADDALVVDTTGLGIDDVVVKIVDVVSASG